MESKPLASILCVTYNQKNYIGQAIESFLMQKTNFPFEIVIGDDCSTDGTDQILTKYREQYPDIIRIITSEEKVGPLKNYIRTRNHCKGKYIALCDGDDYWIDFLKLKKQVDFLEANPDYVMIYTDIGIIDENGKSIETTNFYETQKTMHKSGDIFFDLLQSNFINALTVCLAANIFKELIDNIFEFEKDKWYLYDYWYWLILAKNYKIKFLNEKTAAYRIHKDGISRDNSFIQSRTPFVLFDAVSLIKKADIDTPDKKRIVSQRLNSLLFNRKIKFYSKLKVLGLMIKFSLLSTIFLHKYSKSN